MKISTLYELNKTQAELDFIDIDIEKDIPLFLDPFFLGSRTDRWSTDATSTIRSFFQKLIDLTKGGNQIVARQLFDYLHEPNSTCLGMSTGKPEGRGVGKDKLSDMTTNVIRKHLITYTQAQCGLHNIPLTESVPSDFYWSRRDNAWKTEYTQMLIIDGKKILLVPKGIVSFCDSYTPEKYYNHFVLNFLQNEHLRLNSALVRERSNGKKFVTKKDIRTEHPLTKEFLREFTLKHPDVLKEFKEKTKTGSVKNIHIADLNIKHICKALGEQLVKIPSGTKDASAFHNKILGILELLFYPNLIYPNKEKDIHQGRKRIDITFDNAANTGIFYRLSETMKIPCQYLFIECKNYSFDPVNPELDQLSGRFSVNRGQVGFLVCRSFKNRNLFIERCRDTYKDGRGLIIPLVDQDIINLLDNYDEFNDSANDKYFSDIIREIALS
jgi:hypothetical protein